jgi:hypothetical protein
MYFPVDELKQRKKTLMGTLVFRAFKILGLIILKAEKIKLASIMT